MRMPVCSTALCVWVLYANTRACVAVPIGNKNPCATARDCFSLVFLSPPLPLTLLVSNPPHTHTPLPLAPRPSSLTYFLKWSSRLLLPRMLLALPLFFLFFVSFTCLQLNPIEAPLAFFRGFHEKYPVNDDEKDLLWTLVACRLAISTTCGALSQQKDPGNEYVIKASKQGMMKKKKTKKKRTRLK